MQHRDLRRNLFTTLRWDCFCLLFANGDLSAIAFLSSGEAA